MYTKNAITNCLSILLFSTTIITNMLHAMGLCNSIPRNSSEKVHDNSVKNNKLKNTECYFNAFFDEIAFFYINQTKSNFIEWQHRYIAIAEKSTKEDVNISLKLAIAIITVAEKYRWPIIQELQNTPAGKIITKIKNNDNGHQDILHNIPNKELLQIDIWWLQFFMTGDDKFLEFIFAVAADIDFENDACINAAKWSIISYANQHTHVNEFLKNKQNSS